MSFEHADEKSQASGLLWPTLLTMLGLAILLGLGTWQMQRLAWKDALIAKIVARTSAPPIDFSAALGIYTGSFAEGMEDALEYVRVKVTGRFLHDREQYLYAPHQKLGPGFHVLTPLEISRPLPKFVLVNRGFVPEAFKDRARRTGGLAAGETTLTGLVRMSGEKNSFTPANDPARNLWYWRDLPALISAALPGREREAVLFMVDAQAEPETPGGWPRGGTTELKLPNRHLEYALTWYGLAVTLLVVYLVYVRSRRLPRR